MSLNIPGEKCSVCEAYLFSDDDIVYCPECGAPHHRDCYNTIGRCGLEQYHGTQEQYKKPEPQSDVTQGQSTDEHNNEAKIVCNMCGKTYDKDDTACNYCGAPNISKMGGKFISFDFLGGVPADMDIGEGITADEAKKFVGVNSQRYMPKFAAFKIGKKISWNWAAFLFPCAWFASRKMYAKAVLVGALQVAFTMLSFPFNKAISFLDTSQAANYFEVSQLIMDNLDKIGTSVIYAAFIGLVLQMVLGIVCGIIADCSYKNRVINEVKEIKSSIDDANTLYRRRGGVSLTAALLGVMAVQYLPSIFASLLGLL